MKKHWIIIALVFSLSSFGQTTKADQAAEESELVDFKNIQEVLKKDRLGAEVEKKKKVIQQIKKKRVQQQVGKYQVPGDDTFWSFFSEYWIIKNVQIIKWDFKKPEYGLRESFQEFLQKLGFFEKRFKILLVNTPDIPHFALPSNEGEVIFLLSVPFIRTLDLSKLEISILLLEDYLRLQKGYFKTYVSTPEVRKMIGSNFYKKKFPEKTLKLLSEKYDEMVFDKGFSFQQQHEVTKQMSTLLKGDTKLWNTYYRMLGKIDNLVKSNFLYQKYLKLYPSPELQLNWLKPKAKVL